MQNQKDAIDLALTWIYMWMWYIYFAHDMAIKGAFCCFSKTWKFRDDQNSQKLSWGSWRRSRQKKSRYFSSRIYTHQWFCCYDETRWFKFLGHFNSWNTETELQREGRSTVFLNLLCLRRNSINHQPRQCKSGITSHYRTASLIFHSLSLESNQFKFWFINEIKNQFASGL